jgi:hypothetical protein
MGGEKGSLVAPSLPVLVVDVYGMSVESFAVKAKSCKQFGHTGVAGGAKLNTSEAGTCFSFILLALPGAGAENNPSADTDLLLLLLLLMTPVLKGLFATIELDIGGVDALLAVENKSF